MSVFHRSSDGFEHSEPNRREVLLAAGGLAAATAIAANSGHPTASHPGDKKRPAPPRLTVKIEDTRLNTTFDALAFSFGASADVVATGGESSTGRAIVRELALTKNVDKNTPPLFLTLVTGRHLRKVTLTWVGGTGAPTVTFTLDDVLVTSQTEGGGTDRSHLTEDLALHFRRIQVAHDAVHAGYDISRDTPF